MKEVAVGISEEMPDGNCWRIELLEVRTGGDHAGRRIDDREVLAFRASAAAHNALLSTGFGLCWMMLRQE